AKIENRPVGGNEVVTACQAACPSRAIVFGNLSDPQSAVAQAKASPRNYALLAELNTWPRTTYLARLRNPNPEFETLRGGPTESTTVKSAPYSDLKREPAAAHGSGSHVRVGDHEDQRAGARPSL